MKRVQLIDFLDLLLPYIDLPFHSVLLYIVLLVKFERVNGTQEKRRGKKIMTTMQVIDPRELNDLAEFAAKGGLGSTVAYVHVWFHLICTSNLCPLYPDAWLKVTRWEARERSGR